MRTEKHLELQRLKRGALDTVNNTIRRLQEMESIVSQVTSITIFKDSPDTDKISSRLGDKLELLTKQIRSLETELGELSNSRKEAVESLLKHIASSYKND